MFSPSKFITVFYTAPYTLPLLTIIKSRSSECSAGEKLRYLYERLMSHNDTVRSPDGLRISQRLALITFTYRHYFPIGFQPAFSQQLSDPHLTDLKTGAQVRIKKLRANKRYSHGVTGIALLPNQFDATTQDFTALIGMNHRCRLL